MDQAVKPLKHDTRTTVEVVVHVDEELDEGQRSTLASALKNIDGIEEAEFCASRWHLMLVRYDRDVYSSQEVLRHIAAQRVHAQLIGPV